LSYGQAKKKLPLNIGKNPKADLQTIKDSLELAKIYADNYSDMEQKRYADHYNLHSTDQK